MRLLVTGSLLALTAACSAGGTDSTQPWRDPIATHLPTTGVSGREPVYPLVGGGTDDRPAVVDPPGATFPPTPPAPKPVVVPGDQYFETNSASLTPAGLKGLRATARQLFAARPGAHLRIVGNTDSRGSESANFTLSLARAQAVLAVFLAAGFSSANLVAQGAGEGRPVVSDERDGHYVEALGARNRRVEIYLG